MSRYRGLFTFDTDNHRYVTLHQADGIIDLLDTDDYVPIEPYIKGEVFIGLFKHWAKVNRLIETETDKHKRQFVYIKDKDMLFIDDCNEANRYGIGFYRTTPLMDLESGKTYSYYELVGKE